MKTITNLFIFTVSFIFSFAQNSTDSSFLSKNFKFKDGLFLSFEQVKNNSPIPKSNIICELDKKNYDFFDMLIYLENFAIIDNEGNKKIIYPEKTNIWGYSQEGKLYIFWQKKSNLIPILGTISHFVATYYEYDYSYSSDDFFATYNEPPKKAVTKQYILYFISGEVYEFTAKNLDPIIATDTELYKEWTNLSKRKQKKFKFVYLQKFNQRNPIKLPK